MSRRWLLQITFAGITYRWSDAAVTVVDKAGKKHHFAGGLPDLRVPSDYDPLRNSPQLRSTSVELPWPKFDPLHEAIAAGHEFIDASAELSAWKDDTLYEDRDVVIAGHPTEPQYGSKDETVSFTIKARPWVDSASTHKPHWVVDENTVFQAFIDSDVADLLARKPYPLVFGRPGAINRPAAAPFEAYDYVSPAYAYRWEQQPISLRWYATYLLICGIPVEAETVFVKSNRSTLVYELPVISDTDRYGNSFAAVDLSSLGQYSSFARAINDEELNEWSVAWKTGGGATGSKGLIRTAGDLLEWMLIRFNSEVDWPHFSSVKPWFDRYEISGVLLEPANVYKFIEDVVLPIVPCSATVGPDGVRFTPYRWDATAALAKAHIRVGPGVTTPKQVAYDRVTERSAAYRIRYNPDLENEMSDELILVPDKEPGTNEITSRAVQELSARVGVGSDVVDIESAWITSRETAGRILRAHADMARTTKTEVVHVTGEDFDDLEDGDVVLLTNTARSFDRRACIVHVEHLSPDLRALHLRLLPERG